MRAEETVFNYESTLFEHEPYVNFEILSSDFRCDDSMDFNDDYSSQERRIFEIFSLACSQTLQLTVLPPRKAPIPRARNFGEWQYFLLLESII